MPTFNHRSNRIAQTFGGCSLPAKRQHAHWYEDRTRTYVVEALRVTKPDRAVAGATEKALAEANVKAMTMAANFMVLVR